MNSFSEQTIAEQLAHCDREIAQAIAESRRLHTEEELACLLRCEMDWRLERKLIISEMVMQAAA
jgi:hypothetical protein